MIFGFSFIVFGFIVMVYELYVGRPPFGISVHAVLISVGPTWHPAVPSNSMDGSVYYPDCMLPNVDRCYGMLVGLYPYNIRQLTLTRQRSTLARIDT